MHRLGLTFGGISFKLIGILFLLRDTVVFCCYDTRSTQ